MTLLNLGKRKKSEEQDQMNREIELIQWCSSRPRTAGYLVHPILWLFKCSVIIFQTMHFFMSCWHSNYQPTITNHQTLNALPTRYWLQACLSRGSRSFSRSFLNRLCHSNTCLHDIELTTYTCRSFFFFFNRIKNFRFFRFSLKQSVLYTHMQMHAGS